MAVDSELAAIIGGCVAGAVVLIAIVAVIICLCCGKRRKKKERDQKKFNQLTPHTSPTHSQPSSLSHGPPGQDPRLPKVGSNGLWMGTPGIYAGTPSPAYYYGRPGGKPPSHVMQPAVLQRASSETRIPQRDRQGFGRYQIPARRAASLQRVAEGPAVYSTSGSQQRIYHSQQLASLTPLYEVMDPRNGTIYDVYQIGGGSKTRLLQENGKSSDRHNKNSKKVQRSHSDAAPDPAKRPHRHKPSHDAHRSSKTGSVTRETAEVHAPKEKTPVDKETGVDNVAFIGSSDNINKDEKAAAVASATDSMKLLAKNKTDDQKKVVVPASGSDSDSKKSPPTPVPAPAPDPSLHYTYGGDIYAVPDKEDSRRRSRSENPILARMQAMVVERAEGLEPGHTTDPVTELTETSEPFIITSVESGPGHGASLIQNPIYQEVEEPAVRTHDPDVISEVVSAVKSAADDIDGGVNSVGDRGPASGDVAAEDVAASSALTSLKDVGASGEQEDVVKGALETRWSVDTDAATDELSRAGKHISVTAEAFGFLDTYLSDEDGGDMQSPPKSPVLSDRAEMMY